MRVLVCGGRDWSDVVRLNRVLGELSDNKGIDLIITGGATGADNLGESWAKRNGRPLAIYPAHWRYYGKAAGPTRNNWMLELAKPDLVVAFPGGRGTDDMVERAQARGIRC